MEMCSSKFYKFILPLCVLAVLVGCSDMDTLMPSTGNYKLNLKVSGISLDDCTFIKSSDVILPGFDSPVNNDPDITSLVIFLKNSNGEISGSRVIYKLDAVKSETADTAGNDLNYANNADGKQEEKVNSSGNEAKKTWSDDFDADKNSNNAGNNNTADKNSGNTGNNNTVDKNSGNNGDNNTADKNSNENNNNTADKNSNDNKNNTADKNSGNSDNNTATDKNSGNSDNNAVTGNNSSNSDNNAVTDKNSGNAANNNAEDKNSNTAANDTGSTKNNNANASNELVISVASMGELPPYPMLKNLSTGWYTMVFQVMGDKDTLYKSDKNFYYLADKNFSFKDIYVNLPGLMTGSQYIPKDTVIMLEARIEFDEIFDPYLIWYNGKKIIGEGKYSNNGGKLLWVTPNQSAFLLLRVEAFPITNNKRGLAGYSKQISLPVSSKSADFSLLSKDVSDIKYLYLFDGSLNDSLSPSTGRRALTPSGKVQWMTANGHYGLASGLGCSYSLPDISLPDDGSKAGEFLFRFKPLEDGVVFTAQFGPSFDAHMKLSYEKNNLVLTLESAGKTVSQVKEITSGNAFVSAKTKFVIFQDQLSAKLLLSDEFSADKKSKVEPIFIEARLNGNVKTSLGDQIVNNADKTDSVSAQSPKSNEADNVTANPANAAAVKTTAPSYTALWDEFAFIINSIKTNNSDAETNEKETITKDEALNSEEEITLNNVENQKEVSKEVVTESRKSADDQIL